MSRRSKIVVPNEGVFRGTLSNFKSIPVQVTDRLINIRTPFSLNSFIRDARKNQYGRDATNLFLELLVYCASPRVYGKLVERSLKEIVDHADFFCFKTNDERLDEGELDYLLDIGAAIMDELRDSYEVLLEDRLMEDCHSVLLEFVDRFNLSLRLTIRAGS